MTGLSDLSFDSPFRHGFVRCAVGMPRVHLSEPRRNAVEIARLVARADAEGASLIVFPELGLSGYSLDDLFHQTALLEACEDGLSDLLDRTRELSTLALVGVPLRAEGRLFITAVAIQRGSVLGVVPKSYLPSYREYYEKRQFTAAADRRGDEIEVCGRSVPFGSLLFRARENASFAVFPEICEDLWTPMPPSGWGALAGATVLCNLSASNATVAKAEYRQTLCKAQSGRCVAAYLYAGAGPGESTTDLAWDGHGMIWENGIQLASTERYSGEEGFLVADVDVERLELDRLRMTSFGDSVHEHRERIDDVREVSFELRSDPKVRELARVVARFPYVPSDASTRDERCREVYRIQVQGLSQRLASTGIEKVVIGVSGGLDSTQALLVCAQCFDELGLPRSNILGYSLPGLATSRRTRDNGMALMAGLGVSSHEIDISEASRATLDRIGHPHSSEEPVYDVAFENVQAGERTSLLFRLANHHRGLVVGTGDLSELALGWCTYGVGDQMSHYAVNASVPKTLIQYLIRWESDGGRFGGELSEILESVLATEISPELVPPARGAGSRGDEDIGQPAQSTEEIIGPFELQDFNLYYLSRFGFRPSKVAYLAHCAWADAELGAWPAGIGPGDRRTYDLAVIKRWLEVFLVRFFETSQFKRSAMPNGPKVGSGGSLSPRGDWRAPSDAKAAVWVEELHRNVP